MRFVLFSDTHGKHDKIVVPDGDVLIYSGDMCTTGSVGQVTSFNYFLDKLPHKHKIIVAGNHDKCFEAYDPHTLLNNGVSYLCDKEMKLKISATEYLTVYGTPWTPQFYNWAFMLPRDGEALRKKWRSIPIDIDILISHGPPYGILDSYPSMFRGVEINEVVGCKLLKERINNLLQLKLHVFGHIHASYGYRQVHDTVFVNACICDEEYKPVNRPLVFDYIDGLFQYVS